MGPNLLNDLVELTGGHSYAIDNANELVDVAAKIGIELRNQYMLYDRPKNQLRDGKYRHVSVKMMHRAVFRLSKPFTALGIMGLSLANSNAANANSAATSRVRMSSRFTLAVPRRLLQRVVNVARSRSEDRCDAEQTRRRGAENQCKPDHRQVEVRATRSALRNGRGLRRTARTTLKIALLAPIPRASVSPTMAVKPGHCRRLRKEKRS